MPQTEAKFQINQFTGGLNTDANPIGEQGPTSRDEANCEILSHGGRRRRRGFQPEPGSVESTTTLTSAQKEDFAFGVWTWNDVAGVGDLDFAVLQEGDTLYFFDKGDNSLTLGRKSFTVDLQTFKTSAASTTDVENTRVSVASGKGVIFVCGQYIEPFYVEYNQQLDSITSTQVTIQIRDFEEQSTNIGAKEELNISETPNRGDHLYDMLNQGWYQIGPFLRDGGSSNKDGTAPVLELYRSVIGDFPRKNTAWHLGKYLVAEDSGFESNTYIAPQQVRSSPSGNALAPLGHYILDAFNKDRAAVVAADGDDLRTTFSYYTRLDSLDPEVEDERPVAVAFYAGRVWWALKNNVFFSQQLSDDDVTAAGKCYQDGDPTSEAESDVVATDGGLIPVSGMGRATAMAVTGTALIVLADNGVWSIQGAAGDSFTAVDFSVNRLSTLSCRSPASVVEAEGLVFFWGEHGVYIVQPDQTRDQARLEDLVEGRITEFYNDIPQSSKRNASGFYDPTDKVIYWMYKNAVDMAGVLKNRFAYDRFLNFSLKFSAWYPWTTTASTANQIIGGTTAGGVIASTTQVTVVDSGGVAVTDSGGDVVTTNSTTLSEVSEKPKFFFLDANKHNVAEATNITFTDWPDTDDADYSSYIETFYHLQDDAMAFMQAPYTYIYFRRTDEEATAVANAQVAFDQVNTGGLTSNPSFISELYKSSPPSGEDAPHLPASSALIIGEDGNRYQFEHGGNGTGDNEDTVTIYNVDTGADAWSRTNSQVNADLVAAGVEPSGGYQTTQGEMTCFAVPGTAYFIVIIGQGSGVDTTKGVAYYRIPAGGTPELVGGLSGREGDVSGAQRDLLSPGDFNASGISAFGYINGFSTDLDSGDSRFVAQQKVPYQYQMCVTYFAETRSTCLTLPSINYVIENTPLNTSNVEDWWYNHEEQLADAMDANVLDLRGHPSGSLNRQRAFFLPTSTANSGNLFIPWKQLDIDQHIAGSESVTSTFLQTHDSTYSSGFMSAIPLTITTGGTSFAHSSTLSSTPTVQADSDWVGYPFTDETDDFDGSSGTATNNFTMAPAAYPLYDDDIDGPWLLFWPKVFRNQSQSDKIMIKVMLYDPTDGSAKILDSDSASIVDFSTNTTQTSGHDPEQVSIYWDRTDGTITVQVFYDNASNESLVTSTWGTFTPQITGVDFFAGDGLAVIESSCVLNTRWEWSNNSVSGKVSSDIQVYRGGRMRLVTDTSNPEPTGLPVYVSKTKTRGRGRALQLRLRSETGKDFEIYGWAVWSAKNTRF